MHPVRSRVLSVVDALAHGATTTVYTCPSGRTAIVHALVVANRSSAARRIVVAVRSNGVGASIARFASVPPDSTVGPPTLPIVVGPTDSIEVFSSGDQTSTLVSVFVSGSLLEGEPG